MKRIFAVVLFILATISVASVYHPVYGQRDDEAVRDQTREQLAKLLEKAGPTVNVAFSQSQKQPYNYVGTLRTGLVNTESFEIVISVTPKETIGFRIYPHYKNGYINVDKVNDRAALMRLLLRLSDRAFLFWGADETGDIFTGYTFTLESGFPEEAISIVLKSIVNSDKFVGEMRPLLDAPIEDVTLTTRTSPPAAPAKAAPAKAKVPLRGSRRRRT
jgi:hypothetical protein